MTNQRLCDDRPTTRAQRTILARLFPGLNLRAYNRNRNDYHGYNVGRETLIDAQTAKAEEMHQALRDAVTEHSENAYRHIAGRWSREHNLAEAKAGYEALAETLETLARQARDMAAVVDLRIGDAEADADLDLVGQEVRAQFDARQGA